MSRDYAAELREIYDRYSDASETHRIGVVNSAALGSIGFLARIDARSCPDRMADIAGILDALDEIERSEW